jgi:hypothetical protein
VSRSANYRLRLLTVEEFERFRGKIIEVEQGNWKCWEWTGKRDRFGYARFWLEGQWRAAHRLAYVTMVAGAKEPMLRKAARALKAELTDLDHCCNNESCVRPSHLMATTVQTNQELRALRNRKRVSKREAREVHRRNFLERRGLKAVA